MKATPIAYAIAAIICLVALVVLLAPENQVVPGWLNAAAPWMLAAGVAALVATAGLSFWKRRKGKSAPATGRGRVQAALARLPRGASDQEKYAEAQRVVGQIRADLEATRADYEKGKPLTTNFYQQLTDARKEAARYAPMPDWSE